MPAKPITGMAAAAPPFMTDPTLACRTTSSPDDWFPSAKPGPAAKRAVKLCDECPLRRDCLIWALETRQAHGIYGGKTPAQRLAMLRNWQGRRR